MIKAVVFDVGGVLQTSQSKFFSNYIYKKFQIDKLEFDKAFQKILPLLTTGKINERAFWEKFIKETKSKTPIPKKSPFENKKYLSLHKKNFKVIKIVKNLKQNKYKLAVLSNTISTHAKICREKGLYDLFPIVILSNKVGLKKPDPEIYRLVLKKLDTKPIETIFIDDRKENTNTADKLGFRTIVFKNAEQLKRDLKKFKVSL